MKQFRTNRLSPSLLVLGAAIAGISAFGLAPSACAQSHLAATTGIPVTPQMAAGIGQHGRQNALDHDILNQLAVLNQEVMALEDRRVTNSSPNTCVYGHSQYTHGAILKVGNIELECEQPVSMSGSFLPMKWHNLGPQ